MRESLPWDGIVPLLLSPKNRSLILLILFANSLAFAKPLEWVLTEQLHSGSFPLA